MNRANYYNYSEERLYTLLNQESQNVEVININNLDIKQMSLDFNIPRKTIINAIHTYNKLHGYKKINKNLEEGIMSNILERCVEIIEKEDNCNEFEKKGSCLQCVKSSFDIQNKNSDTYNCLKKLATYTIEYGIAYASEIYAFLTASQILETYFDNNEINILSLGCGFMPDNSALRAYIENNELDKYYSYKGYDIEPLWKEINPTNNFITKDIIDGFDCKGIDIIFMNKVFSTLKNHKLSDKFLETFKKELKELSSGALVVFNDINYQPLGRDEFHRFAIHNSLESIEQYFFNRDGEYTGNYTEIEYGNKYQVPNNLPFEPRDAPTKTVFFLYRKK